MKKFFQLTGLLTLPSTVLLIALATGLKAQYIGSGRPMGKAETLDSVQAAENRARFHADSVAGDSLQGLLTSAKVYADSSAGDSAQAVLNIARGDMPDTSAAVFNRLILFYVRISGDSLIVDSARLVAKHNLRVGDTLTVGKITRLDTLVNASGLIVFKDGGLFQDSLIVGKQTSSSGTSLPLRVRTDANAAVMAFVENSTAGTAAGAGYRAQSSSAKGYLLAESASHSNVQLADKIILYAETDATALALLSIAAGGKIEFYTDGTAAGNKEAYVSASGLTVTDTTLTRILKITGEYSLPPNDTTAGLAVKSNGPGQPWYYAPDEVAAAGAADSMVIGGIAHDSVTAHESSWGHIDTATVAGMISDSLIQHPVTRPDSVLYEGQWYNEIIGWDGTPEETITLTVTAGIDSTAEDSLWTAINRLKSSGGDIYLKTGDTLWITRGGDHLDSLPTSGGITKEVRVWGSDRGRMPVIHGANTSVNTYSFNFTGNRNANGGLVFNNVNLSGPKTGSHNSIESLEVINMINGRIVFNRCKISGIPIGINNSAFGQDSSITYNYCELDSAGFNATVGVVTLNHCYGTVGGWTIDKSLTHSGQVKINNCNLENWGDDCFGRDGSVVRINNSKIYFQGNTRIITHAGFYANQSTFEWKTTNTLTYLYGDSLMQFTDCNFIKGWIYSDGTGEGEVTACHFNGGTNGIVFNAGSGARALIHGNSFSHVTTCITFPASGATYAVATANSSVNVTSLISGVATKDSLNVDAY